MTPAPTPDLSSRVGTVASPSPGGNDLASRVADVATNGISPVGDKPAVSPEEEESQTRQMLVSGLTGMPTPNMNEQDRASFERGKVAGAMSVPIVAGATIGGTQIAQGLSAAVPSTIEHVKAIGTWAAKNPVQAYLIFKALQETIPSFKKLAGIVDNAPTGQ